MKIRNGITFIWAGTNATIPSGWVRATSMDSKYAKGTAAGVDPNVAGGADTHTHSSPAHTHSMVDHAHIIYIPAGSYVWANAGGSHSPYSVQPDHYHDGYWSYGITAQAIDNIGSTYSAVSNSPLYHQVIFITPVSDTPSGKFPVGIIGLADADAPAGFNICDGTNSTPNLDGKFLMGAAAAGDAGATGGSTQNVHGVSHSHYTYHYHPGTTSGGYVGGSYNSGVRSGGTGCLWGNHTHTVQLDGNTVYTTNNITQTTTETVEPAYTKLLAIRNTSATQIPKGIIAMWMGTLTAIPLGWIHCDGADGTVDMRGRHLKVTKTLGEVGNTGGSNTHTHAAQAHSHTVSHYHTAPNLQHYTADSSVQRYTSGGTPIGTNDTWHYGNYGDWRDITTSSTNTTADSSNNEPSYRTVAFIKLKNYYHTAQFLISFA